MHHSVTDIFGLSADTPLPVNYTGRKYRGLGMFRVVRIHSITKTQLHMNDVHSHGTRNTRQEQELRK